MPRVLSPNVWVSTGVNGGFFVQYEDNTLYFVTNVSVGGGTATQVYQDLINGVKNSFLSSPSATTVVWNLEYGLSGSDSWRVSQSTDGGVNFTEPSWTLSNVTYPFSYWKMMAEDLSNSNIVWGSYFSSVAATDYGLLITDDGGSASNWNRIVTTIVASAVQWGVFAASRHNGTDGLHVTSYTKSGGAHVVRVRRHDTSGNILQTRTYPDNSFKDGGGDGSLFFGCVQYGSPNILYGVNFSNNGNVWKTDISTGTIVYLGQLNGGTTVFRQVLSTRAGTILIVDSWTAAPHNYWLRVWRTIDSGTTWTSIDLTSLLPSSRDLSVGTFVDWWDYIALDKNDVFYIPLEDGTVLFSSDDAATWTKSAVFLPVYADVGKIHDNSGVGNA